MGKADFGDGASPGKIFIGGLAKDTTLEQFVEYFGKYGEITDSVIMKDRATGRPRGFGFITYADPSVVDVMIAEVHVINDKQVEIKRTIPKATAESKNFRTKKIFVGGIPTSVSEDEFKSFFSKYGNVVEREIIRDHATKRSRGFGFIVFESDQAVDTLLANGNFIDMNGTQVEIKKAEPKKPSNPGPAPAISSDHRKRPYQDAFPFADPPYSHSRNDGVAPGPYRPYGTTGFVPGPYRPYDTPGFAPGSYRSYVDGGYGPAPYRSLVGNRPGDYSKYGEFPAGDYGYKLSDGRYTGSFADRYGSYASGGYGYDGYSGAGSAVGYEAGPGGSHGEPEGPYGGRTGYGSGGRFHPYGR